MKAPLHTLAGTPKLEGRDKGETELVFQVRPADEVEARERLGLAVEPIEGLLLKISWQIHISRTSVTRFCEAKGGWLPTSA